MPAPWSTRCSRGGPPPAHGHSFTWRAARALKRLVTASAANEVAEVTRIAEVLQQPVTTGRQIAVTSIRGGAGKTTVAALLGTTYAHYRQDPVLLVEADPALGSLPLRLGAETLRWTTATSRTSSSRRCRCSTSPATSSSSPRRLAAAREPGPDRRDAGQQGVRRVMVRCAATSASRSSTARRCPPRSPGSRSPPPGPRPDRPRHAGGVTSTYSVLQWMQGLPPHVIAGTVVVLTEL